jgi:hypothetical protein
MFRIGGQYPDALEERRVTGRGDLSPCRLIDRRLGCLQEKFVVNDWRRDWCRWRVAMDGFSLANGIECAKVEV